MDHPLSLFLEQRKSHALIFLSDLLKSLISISCLMYAAGSLSASYLYISLVKRKWRTEIGPWDVLISLELFLDVTETEVSFPGRPQSQQVPVITRNLK